MIKEQDGKVYIKQVEDVQPLLDANGRLRSIYDELPRGRTNRLAGRIPGTVAANWAKECGHAIGTKGFAEYAKKKLLDSDFQKLRIEKF